MDIILENSLAVHYLLQRGIDLEKAFQAGMEIQVRDSHPSGIYRARLGFDHWGNELLPNLVKEAAWFPCRDLKGSVQGYVARIFPELVGKDDKPAKFLATRNGGGYPFIPSAVWEAASKPHRPVCFTEGPVKALSLQQVGALPIGLNGVWSATCKTDDSFPRIDLHPVLREFLWRGRKAYLVFDADLEINPSVRHALIRALIVFAAHNADAGVLRWKIDEGRGIDDFLAGKANGKVPLPELFALMCDGKVPLPGILKTFDLEMTEMDLVHSRLSGVTLEQVCRLCAKPLNVRASSLLAGILEERQRLEAGVEEPLPTIVPRSLSDILHSIRIHLKRYVVFPFAKEQSLIVALWIAHTWFFKAFDYTPYLSVRSPAIRSGKTRLFEVSKTLCRNVEMTEGATAAALIRMINDTNPPTFLLDEMDTVYNRRTSDPEAENMRRFLNAGFKRGAVFCRCAWHGKEIFVEKLPAFCPKAIAAVGDCLPDSVADRSIPIELERQKKGKKAQKMRDRDATASTTSLRDELKVLSRRQKLLETLNKARPEMPDELNDRQQDICEPLLAIADEAGEKWGKAARAALKKLYGQQDKERDLSVRLLADIKRIFDQAEEPAISTEALLRELVEIADDAPWAEWFEDLLKNGKIKSAGSKLAYRLKRYGIKPITVRIEDETPRGYRRDQFEDTWERYLENSSPEVDATNKTDKTPLARNVASVASVASENGEKISSEPAQTDQPDGQPGRKLTERELDLLRQAGAEHYPVILDAIELFDATVVDYGPSLELLKPSPPPLEDPRLEPPPDDE